MDQEFLKEARKVEAGKTVPHSMDAEKGLLSSLLQEEGLTEKLGWLSEEHFYYPLHATLYATIRGMREEGHPVDMVTVTEKLAGKMEAHVVSDMALFVPTSANADYYAGIVAEKFARRRVMAVCAELARRAATDESGPEQLLDDAESALVALRMGAQRNVTLQPLATGLKAALKNIEAAYDNRGKEVNRPDAGATGLVDFDRMTGGLKPGQLVVFAARPAMGKTSLMLQSARYMATKFPVAIFSMEMTLEELATRLICAESSLNLARLRDGFLSRQQLPEISRGFNQVHKLPIWVDESPALSCFDFRSRARMAVTQHGVKAIFVDYLQLMRSTSKRSRENRAMEVAEISMTLKATAKELGVFVVALAQLNRDAENRSGPPKLADLRESGQIEQDSDIVAFLYRPKKDSEDAAEKEAAQLIVAKHRDGAPGTVNLRFVGEFARFENVTEKMYSNNVEKRQK